MQTRTLILALLTLALMPLGGGAASAGAMHFSYVMPGNGPYVRRASGTIDDPEDFRNLLDQLRPPPGAHGGYGLLGDDQLLGLKPGGGLRALGALAREYISFDSLYVVQPPGFENAGVQPGTFTNAKQMNDTTLGWVFFDLRPQFEAGLKAFLGSDPAPQSSYMVFFDKTLAGVTLAGTGVIRLAAISYGALKGKRIDLVGHDDTAEADPALWRKDVQEMAPECRRDNPATRHAEPTCALKHADPLRLGYMRAQHVADILIAYGVPKEAIRVTSAGAGDPLVPTPKATSEPMNRRVTITIH